MFTLPNLMYRAILIRGNILLRISELFGNRVVSFSIRERYVSCSTVAAKILA